MEYTEQMISTLKAKDTLTYDEAKTFAEANDISLQSVIGKARALEVTYIRKEEVAKTRETKAEVVAQIEDLMGVTFKRLDALLMEDLVALRDLFQ